MTKKENYPSVEAISDAEDFLRQRLNAELSMSNNLSYYLREAAERIVNACINKGIPADSFSFEYDSDIYNTVEDVLQWLKEMLADATITLAEASPLETNKEEIEEYIYRDIEGDDFDDRLFAYIGTFRKEMSDFVKYAIAAKVIGKLVKWDTNWRDYSHGGISAYNGLNRLTKHTIADAWMNEMFKYIKSDGAIGYYVMRGSSYPCETCDSYVGFHPITDTESVPPYHAHCCCIMVPIKID